MMVQYKYYLFFHSLTHYYFFSFTNIHTWACDDDDDDDDDEEDEYTVDGFAYIKKPTCSFFYIPISHSSFY